jgi:hypothetical protein
MSTTRKPDGIEVQWHSWDTAPAALWPLIQDWIRRQRQAHALFFIGELK